MSESDGYSCRYCSEFNPEWMPNCPRCLVQGAMVKLGYKDSTEETVLKEISTLEDVEALSGERIDTGIPGLNRVFGRNRGSEEYGLYIPSVTAFAGGQGCGKTTLVLTMLALMKERRKLLLHTEQSLPEIKSSLIGIGLGNKASKIHAYSLLKDDCEVSVAMKKIRYANPRVVIVDSINKMRDSSFKSGDKFARQVHIVDMFKKDADENDRATILISHLTKEDKIAGARELLHDVSTVMMLVKQGERLRLLHCPEKNRFGDTTEKAYFEMGRHGLVEVEGPGSSKTSDLEDPKIREQWGLPPLPKSDKLKG